MTQRPRIRYSPEQRAANLISLYQYILTKATGHDLQGNNWKSDLVDVLPSEEDTNSLDMFLPRTMNSHYQDGSVNSVWCLFNDPDTAAHESKRTLGIWYLHLNDATVFGQPNPEGYQKTPWRVSGFPQSMIYVWSEQSRVTGQSSTVKQCDIGTWLRIMQARLMEWVPADQSPGDLAPRKWVHKQKGPYQALMHGALQQEFTGHTYDEVLNDQKARWYQARFDERLQTLVDIVRRSAHSQTGRDEPAV